MTETETEKEATDQLVDLPDDLPDDVDYLVKGNGKVIHCAGGRGRGISWCNMFYTTEGLRPADSRDVGKKVCGSCLTSLDADLARERKRKRDMEEVG